MKQAVVDRVEGELAVLLVGQEEWELVVPIGALPEGSGPDVWLRITLEGEHLIEAEVDMETTRARQALVREKMERLLQKRPRQT